VPKQSHMVIIIGPSINKKRKQRNVVRCNKWREFSRKKRSIRYIGLSFVEKLFRD